MKKWMALFLSFACVLILSACRSDDTYTIQITVPAGSTDAFVYSEEEIAATGKKIIISSVQGSEDTTVILHPVNELTTAGYVATYITPGLAAEFDAMPGEWFKIGVSVQNPTDTDRTFTVRVEGVEIRIE